MSSPEVAVAQGKAFSGSKPRPAALTLDWSFAGVVALTLVAAGVRIAIIRDSLQGDELSMFGRVHGYGLGQVFSIVRATENTPPLFFVFAWASAKIGDPTLWIRLPSLLFGTALVPLTYALARITVGRAAGLIAAAILALDPYAIFYGTEARPYTALAFFATLSTLCLLHALQTRRRRWWAGYGLAVLAVIYTHYTGIFVLVVQAVWALWTHRQQLRPQIIVYALVALAFLPWFPSFLLQHAHSGSESDFIAQVSPPSLSLFAQINLVALIGHPFVPLHDLPGWPAVTLALAAIGTAAIVVAVRRHARVRLCSRVTLLVLLAVASPLGIVLVGLLPRMSFMLARNLIASLVPAALLVGWLLTSVRGRAGVATIAALLLVLSVGAAGALQATNRRSPYRSVAHFIEARARPGDPIIQTFFTITPGPWGDVVIDNLSRPHPIYRTAAAAVQAWAKGRRGADVFYVIDLPGFWRAVKHLPRRSGPGNDFVLIAEHKYVGLSDVLVGEYQFMAPTRAQPGGRRSPSACRCRALRFPS